MISLLLLKFAFIKNFMSMRFCRTLNLGQATSGEIINWLQRYSILCRYIHNSFSIYFNKYSAIKNIIGLKRQGMWRRRLVRAGNNDSMTSTSIGFSSSRTFSEMNDRKSPD